MSILRLGGYFEYSGNVGVYMLLINLQYSIILIQPSLGLHSSSLFKVHFTRRRYKYPIGAIFFPEAHFGITDILNSLM